MRLLTNIFTLFLALLSVRAAEDGCPKGEYACLDVINASQCIEQLVIEKQRPATKENLVKCVEHEGTATTLPGAVKVSLIDRFGGRWDRG